MIYNRLGRSGLNVSQISYGNFISSTDGSGDLANQMVKLAWDNGINFFDTAEGYDNGMGEHQLGAALKNLNVSRDQLVVSTKIFFGGDFPTMKSYNPHMKIQENQKGTSRKHLIQGLKRSLENLQMDYVDIVFCHRYDEYTPIEEVCHAMKVMLNKGMALYWGTSEWPAQRIIQAIYICDKIGCPRPVAEQCQYNILNREGVEYDYSILLEEYGQGTTTFSPVMQGFLSGKYNDGKIPEASRFTNPMLKARFYNPYFGTPEKAAQTMELLAKYKDLCENKVGCTMAQFAIAWVAKYEHCSTCLIGASSFDMLTSNLEAIKVIPKITDEIEKEVEEIFKTKPVQEMNWLIRTPMPDKRLKANA